MALLNALRTAGSAVRRNPVLLVATTLVGVLQMPQLFAQTIDSLAATAVSLAFSALWRLLVPFVQGGVLGMANEAIDGDTRLGRFVREGSAHYVSLFAVYLLLVAVSLVLGVVVVVAGFFGLGGMLISGGDHNTAVLAAVAVVAVLVGLCYLLAAFFLQFYGHAIVVDDVGAVEGLRRSARCVRRNLPSSFGYSVVSAVVGAAFGLFGAAFSVLTTPAGVAAFDLPTLSLAGAVGLLAAFAVVTGLVSALMAAFSVAFYREIRAATPA